MGICKILCRRRQLDEQKLLLFLGPEEDVVVVSDCTLIGANGYSLIASFCPNITTLELSLCGRINGLLLKVLIIIDEAMELFASSLKSVRKLKLGGCFLVSDVGLGQYLNTIAAVLDELTITEGEKLTMAAFEHVFSHARLRKLVLKRCPGLDSEFIRKVGAFKNLSTLKLVNVGMNIIEDAYCDTFGIVGSHLNILGLSGYQFEPTD